MYVIKHKEVLSMETVQEEARKIKKTAEELNADATSAKENITDLKKQMKELQKELEKKEKILKQSRSRRRTHKAMVFYGTLIKIVDLQEEEAQCATDEDFDNLHNRILRKVKRLWNKDEGDSTSDNKNQYDGNYVPDDGDASETDKEGLMENHGLADSVF